MIAVSLQLTEALARPIRPTVSTPTHLSCPSETIESYPFRRYTFGDGIALTDEDTSPESASVHKAQTMLIPGIFDPFREVNVSELQDTVDAVKSVPMPGSISGPEDCGE